MKTKKTLEQLCEGLDHIRRSSVGELQRIKDASELLDDIDWASPMGEVDATMELYDFLREKARDELFKAMEELGDYHGVTIGR